jgi:hypothetical protein
MRSPSTSASFADFIFCIFFDVGFDCLSFLVHWVQVGFLRPQYHSIILNFIFLKLLGITYSPATFHLPSYLLFRVLFYNRIYIGKKYGCRIRNGSNYRSITKLFI